MSNENRPERRVFPGRSVEEIILSVFISLLVLVLGVALGGLRSSTVLLCSAVVLCSVAAGAILTYRALVNIGSGAHSGEVLRSIQAELTHITHSLPTHLLTEEQYSGIESSSATKAVVICMQEMGLEFDTDPDRREILKVSYDAVVRSNIERGVSYHWIAPNTALNRVRTEAIQALLPARSIRIALLESVEWDRLPFVFETVFIVSEFASRRHIDGFLQIPISGVGLERYWIRIDPNRRDEWFGMAGQHVDEALIRLRQPGAK